MIVLQCCKGDISAKEKKVSPISFCKGRDQCSKGRCFSSICIFFSQSCNALALANWSVCRKFHWKFYLFIYFIYLSIYLFLTWTRIATAKSKFWENVPISTLELGFNTSSCSWALGLKYPFQRALDRISISRNFLERPRLKTVLGILPDSAGLEMCGMQLLGPITADWWFSVKGTQLH